MQGFIGPEGQMCDGLSPSDATAVEGNHILCFPPSSPTARRVAMSGLPFDPND